MGETRIEIGFGPLVSMLAVAFIVLRLCGVIDWHWAWVLAPLWGDALVKVLFIGIDTILGGGGYDDRGE